MTLSESTTMEMWRGEQIPFGGTATDADGSAVKLTGATVYFAVYASYPSGTVTDDTGAMISKSTGGNGIVVTDVDAGEFTITIDSADTEDWELSQEPTNYVYGVEYQPAGQTYRVTLGRGVFTVYHDVVRA